MKLLPNWREILRNAWSVRFVVASGLLSAADVILSLWFQVRPTFWLAVASGTISILALVARLVPQKSLHKE